MGVIRAQIWGLSGPGIGGTIRNLPGYPRSGSQGGLPGGQNRPWETPIPGSINPGYPGSPIWGYWLIRPPIWGHFWGSDYPLINGVPQPGPSWGVSGGTPLIRGRQGPDLGVQGGLPGPPWPTLGRPRITRNNPEKRVFRASGRPPRGPRIRMRTATERTLGVGGLPAGVPPRK